MQSTKTDKKHFRYSKTQKKRLLKKHLANTARGISIKASAQELGVGLASLYAWKKKEDKRRLVQASPVAPRTEKFDLTREDFPPIEPKNSAGCVRLITLKGTPKRVEKIIGAINILLGD